MAISGQHLAILCGLFTFSGFGRLSFPLIQLTGLTRRRAAWLILFFVIGYALLTGLRPPVVRAAVIVGVLSIGILIHRKPRMLNSLAAAWLLVAWLNPSDPFQVGTQLSFLAVLMVYQVVQPLYDWYEQTDDPLKQLLLATRTPLERFGAWIWRVTKWGFLTSLIIYLALAPLLAARNHLLSPVVVLLTPLLTPLIAVALIAGFFLFLLAPISTWMADGLAGTIDLCLWACDGMIDRSQRIPLSYWYCADVPEVMLWLFYVGLLAMLLVPSLHRHWKSALVAGLLWLLVVLFRASSSSPPAGLRCTVLAVGHGACTVIETPDGRVMLYDTGSLLGPEVTARQIAPFLWSRGISRIDEVFLSHADLDHFNGLPALMERFRVGQISTTPTFQHKRERGLQFVVSRLQEHGIDVRILTKDQRLEAGPITIDVLHPPTVGPEGTENAHSLVLLIRGHGYSILLTGDLEQPGLGQVMGQAAPRVDVLLAPHHGSSASNTSAFAQWAQAGLVISSEGRERAQRVDPYQAVGGVLWRTWRDGAVVIDVDTTGIQAATFRTGKSWATR